MAAELYTTLLQVVKEVIENIIRRRRKDWIRRELLDWSRESVLKTSIHSREGVSVGERRSFMDGMNMNFEEMSDDEEFDSGMPQKDFVVGVETNVTEDGGIKKTVITEGSGWEKVIDHL